MVDGGNESRTYRLEFSEKAGPRTCTVKGCSGRASTQMVMIVQLWRRHIRDTVVIL